MSTVAVIRTSPQTYFRDVRRAMILADYRKHLGKEIILKLNLSWTLFFPACSTPPYQLDAVLNVLKNRRIYPVENQTVVTHPWLGAWHNRWLSVLKKYGIDFIPLTDVKWIEYKPKSEMLALDELFHGKIMIPELFIGKSVLHLPTLKTHGHTTTTGAMKNAFGGLIPKYRHHAHKKIHEVLVDLLAIQKEIHSGLFALVDGSVAGNGAGPRTMRPVTANLIIAGADQVAVDAVSARIMGFDPLSIPYLKIAHERGLGNADIESIEIVGDFNRRNLPNLGFKVSRSPVIFFDQFFRKFLGQRFPLLEKLIFHTPLFHLAILASKVYHDYLWYPLIGKARVEKFLESDWGALFLSYEKGEKPKFKKVKEWDPY